MKIENNIYKSNIAKKLSIRLNEISKGLSYKVDEIEYIHNPYVVTQENLSLKLNAWNTKECQDMYKSFIKLASSFKIVKYGMRKLAKQMAVNCYIQKVEPDLEDFKNKVIIANDNY